MPSPFFVIPAKAGISFSPDIAAKANEIPAFAGMTGVLNWGITGNA
ncbi:hypothetical protein [Sphingomonas cavernae]|nr:hypothetical protein [Sphingomonas cavernae]